MKAPGVYHVQADTASAVTRFEGTATGIGAFVGVFERGPVGDATFIGGLAEFYAIFGSQPVSGYEPDWHNIVDYFRKAEGHGPGLWIVRTAHYTDYTDPDTLTASKASLALSDGTATTLTVYAKGEGSYGNELAVKVEAGDLDTTNGFHLSVYDQGILIYQARDIQLADTTAADYAPAMINDRNDYVTVVDASRGTRPSVLATTNLAGGTDGLTGLADSDFYGAAHADGGTGLHALDGLWRTLSPPEFIGIPRFCKADSSSLLLLTAYCNEHYCFAVGAPPDSLNRTAVKDWVSASGSYSGQATVLSSMGELIVVWPWVVPMEQKSNGQYGLAIPALGAKMGLMAKASETRWLAKAAAGLAYGLPGTAWLSGKRKTSVADSELLDPLGVQVIRSDKGLVVDGSRTMTSDRTWIFEGVRRAFNYFTHVFDQLDEKLHEPNSPITWAAIKRSVYGFLLGMFQAHSEFWGSTEADEAFFAQCDESTQTAAEIDQGICRVRYGAWIAPSLQQIIIEHKVITASEGR